MKKRLQSMVHVVSIIRASVLLAAMMCVCVIGNAQILSYNRTVLSGLTFTQIPGGTVINSNAQLSSGTIGTNDDDGGVLVTLPFTFTYDGTNYTQATFCTNGWVGFGNQTGVSVTNGRSSSVVFSTTTPNSQIAAWAGDGSANWASGGGSMVHGLIGTDIYAFEWRNASGNSFNNSTTIRINYQIVIYGPNSTNPGRIEMLYGGITGSISTGRAIAIEDAVGGTGRYINALNGLSNNTTTASAWPGNGNGYRFDPLIYQHPKNLNICVGNSADFTVAANGGTSYQWQESTNSGATWTNLVSAGNYGGTNTNTLNIFVTNSGMNGYQYRCIVTGPNQPATSMAGTLTVNTPPVITTQPGSSVQCDGVGANFAVLATGTNLSYQWQVNQGGGFVNVTNTGVYSGANTGNLVLSSTTLSMDGYQYRCEVSNCTAINTTYASLTVRRLPAVTSNPTSITRCSGTSASFSIVGVASGIVYQWQESTDGGGTWNNLTNTGIYTGVLTPTLSISSVSLSMNNYQYRCNVSGTCPPSVNSTGAILTVGDNPVITTQPANSTICSGANASFSITTTGAGQSYQWQVNQGGGFSNVTNTGVYSGATTPTLTITGATNAMNGYLYKCYVTSICNTGGVYSNFGTLNINPLPSVTLQPVNSTVCVGTNAGFNIAAAGAGLTYQWQENNGGGFVNLINGGIYSGCTTNSLLLTGVTIGMNAYTYRCVVSGTCTPAANSNAATLTINTPPAITTNPVNRVICQSGSTTFTVAATGTGLTYQWQVNPISGSGFTNITNGGVYSGATTTTLTITGATLALNGSEYRCMVSGTCPPAAYTTVGLLTVQGPPVITTQPPTALTLCQYDNASFGVVATGTGLTYQWQQSTNGGSTWANLTNGGVYNNVNGSNLGLIGVTPSMNTYRFRVIVSGTCTPSPVTSGSLILTVNTVPLITSQSSMNVVQCEGTSTVMSVTAIGTSITYQWQESTNAGLTWTNLTNVAPYTNVTTASMTLSATPLTLNGRWYKCVVSGICAPPSVSQPIALTVNQKPVITTQPTAVALCEGLNTGFSVAAIGTGISYQWQVNPGSGFVNITNNFTYNGAQTPNLSLTSVTTSMNNYQYRCIVTGVCAPVATSSAVVLTVYTIPVLTSQPVDRSICQGTNTTFSTTATGTSLTYQWQLSTDGGTSWNNLLAGAPYSNVTSATMTITGATLSLTGNLYRCVVNGTCAPPSTTLAAKLTVWATTAITSQTLAVNSCPGDTIAVSFGLAAQGAGLTYNWQMNAGAGWVAVPSGTFYSGQTTSSMTITGIKKYMNGYQFRCIVSGNCGSPVTSQVIPLTVENPVVIQIHTLNALVCEGGKVKIGVKALGSALNYRWQVQTTGGQWEDLNNAPPYAGVSTDSLTVSGIDTLHGKLYRCIVNNTAICSFYKDSTKAIQVQVLQAPYVAPINMNVKIYQAAIFNVQMGGLYYQWQVSTDGGNNWTDLTNTPPYIGTDRSTMRIYPLNMSLNNNKYRCVVDGICATTTISKPATLTIDPAVGVSQVATKGMNYMTVYPNPVSETTLNIRFDEEVKGKTQIRIMDKIGRTVKVLEVVFKDKSASIDVAELAAGTYTLHVVNESEQLNSSVRFTKQ